MTPEEIEDAAYNGGPMPDIHSMAEAMLFQSFRSLYDFARRSGMSPEQGKREKAQLMDAFRTFRFWEDLLHDNVQMWKNMELAASDYRKAPSVEKADRILEIICGAKRKEQTHEMEI